jgi:hypothetical protein
MSARRPGQARTTECPHCGTWSIEPHIALDEHAKPWLVETCGACGATATASEPLPGSADKWAMQWLGEDEFIFTCRNGDDHDEVVAALGIDSAEMPYRPEVAPDEPADRSSSRRAELTTASSPLRGLALLALQAPSFRQERVARSRWRPVTPAQHEHRGGLTDPPPWRARRAAGRADPELSACLGSGHEALYVRWVLAAVLLAPQAALLDAGL